MHISELVVFPIKSLRGVSVPSSPVEKRGLQHDRRWMIVDGDGLFLTQRKLHKMALFDVALTSSGLRVAYAGSAIDIAYVPAGNRVPVQVWQSHVEARHVSREADEWFSSHLGVDCRLVYLEDEVERHVTGEGAQPGDLVGFADSNPILVAGESSLADLNARLEDPIPMRRFRANVVISGSAAFDEDGWREIRTGEVRLRRTKRCGRCIVTTLDIESASPSQEPLRTLATYRKKDNNVFFGTYYAPEVLGTISVGDPIATV